MKKNSLLKLCLNSVLCAMKIRLFLVCTVIFITNTSEAQNKYVEFKYTVNYLTIECRYCHETHTDKYFPLFDAIIFTNKSDDIYYGIVLSELFKKTYILPSLLTTFSVMSKECDIARTGKHGVNKSESSNSFSDKFDRANIKKLYEEFKKSEALKEAEKKKKNEEEKQKQEKEAALEKEQVAKQRLINIALENAFDSIDIGYKMSEKSGNTTSPSIIRRNLDIIEELGYNNPNLIYKDSSGQEWSIPNYYMTYFMAQMNTGQFSECIKWMTYLEQYWNQYRSNYEYNEIKGMAYLLNGEISNAKLALGTAVSLSYDPCQEDVVFKGAMTYFQNKFPQNKNISPQKISEIAQYLVRECPDK